MHISLSLSLTQKHTHLYLALVIPFSTLKAGKQRVHLGPRQVKEVNVPVEND